jgi:DNA-binding MurR/RpiR family transcriptional regulator
MIRHSAAHKWLGRVKISLHPYHAATFEMNVARILACDYAPLMERGPLADRIVTAFETMPGRLQMAARYAVLSMREQARRTGGGPTTITRFARRLGLDGDEPIREFYLEVILGEDLGFAGTAGLQVASRKLKSERALAAEMVESLTNQIARLSQPDLTERLVASAALLAFARRIYCRGLRAWHAIAWQFDHVLSLLGDCDVLAGAIPSTGRDSICFASSKDLVFAVGVEPSTRATMKAAQANKCGVPIVALMVSAMSPRARVAGKAPTDEPSFLHSLKPTFAAVAAAFGGEALLAALRGTEAQHAAFRVHRSQESRAVRCRRLR